MRVVILTTEQGNQVALCNKLAAHCELAGIVLSKNVSRKPSRFSKRLAGLAARTSVRLLGRPFLTAWWQMQREYVKCYPRLPDVPTVRVNNINDEPTLEMLRQQRPDLIVVSGTNLVNRQTMESASDKARFINLHTGISPFMKGGPNCSNWCLAEGTFHLIGNTIMWLDLGIDSGNIITTEQTTLTGKEGLFELHWKVMEHAHDLYCRVVSLLAQGQQLPSVSQQSIGSGKTYYGVEWNGLAARRALNNFKVDYPKFFQSPEAARAQIKRLKLIPLETGSK
jgi:methionyl-tRNA formyltransferase